MNIRKEFILLIALLTPTIAYSEDCTKIVDVHVERPKCFQRKIDELSQIVSQLRTQTVPKNTVAAFNLPECPAGWKLFGEAGGRMIVGKGQIPGQRNKIFRSTGGEETTVLGPLQMPRHNHEGTTQKGSPMRYRAVHDNGGNYGMASNHVRAWRGGSGFNDRNDDSYSLSNHTHKFVTTLAGRGRPHNNMPPFIVLTYCEKL
mgnify:CR=1 FL=1